MADPAIQAQSLIPVSFDSLTGWRDGDHRGAYSAFMASAARLCHSVPKTRRYGISGRALAAAGIGALREMEGIRNEDARAFFERNFRPARIPVTGFVTAYYEPVVDAARGPCDEYKVPIYRRPDDLVAVDGSNRPAGWDPDIRFARAGTNRLEAYPDRDAIENGALAGRGLELAWVRDFVTAFFIHVQGSARLQLTDGSTMRIAYDGKSGHAYTSIGKRAVARGLLPAGGADKAALERWLRTHPADGLALMRENRSFIFFKATTGLGPEDGPIGAAGVPLTAGRSLAVDRRWITFHTPVWVDADDVSAPGDRNSRQFRRLMIAQDTGSAIVGPSRGDLFFGSGEAAGEAAGRVRAAATMTLLVPLAGESRS